MIELVISGGQTGADQAGLRAAKAAGIPTGGWAPVGWLTETGSAPWLADEFVLKECPEPDFNRPPGMPLWQYQAIYYKARTYRNAADADATIWFGRGDSRGFNCTAIACRKSGRPIWTVLDPESPPDRIVTLIQGFGHSSINIAGNRESKAPGIGAWVEAYLTEVFRLLREAD